MAGDSEIGADRALDFALAPLPVIEVELQPDAGVADRFDEANRVAVRRDVIAGKVVRIERLDEELDSGSGRGGEGAPEIGDKDAVGLVRPRSPAERLPASTWIIPAPSARA